MESGNTDESVQGKRWLIRCFPRCMETPSVGATGRSPLLVEHVRMAKTTLFATQRW